MDAYTIPGESIPVFFLNVSVPCPYLKKLRRLFGDDRVVGWGWSAEYEIKLSERVKKASINRKLNTSTADVNDVLTPRVG